LWLECYKAKVKMGGKGDIRCLTASYKVHKLRCGVRIVRRYSLEFACLDSGAFYEAVEEL
jgi:hypothetical protein